MNRKPVVAVLAILLTVSFVIPATFFITPQRAAAQSSVVGCVGNLLGLSGLFSAVGLGVPVVNPAIQGATASTAATTASECLYKMVVVPLARQLIQQILRDMTSSIINWINGGNGTGQPSFVQNLSRHLQQLGDSVALPFIALAQRVTNPAFWQTMGTSLLMKYAMGSSVGGYLAANQGTLSRYSPNQSAFLAGNWAQGGGTTAWFALTTQNNNNPYLFIPAADAQLRSLVNQASINRRQDLAQSGGFMSWCGPQSASSGSNGVAPTAPCTNSDGSAGNIQTPGTVIRDQVQQSLGADMAQLINPADIDSALAAIFGAALRQGMNAIFGAGGLLGASQPSSGRPQSITSALQSAAADNSATITAANTAASTVLSRLSTYTTAWTTISNAANLAKSSVTSLKANCSAQASAADTALVSVNAVLAQAQTAMTAVSGTQALAFQVQTDAQNTTAAGATKLNTDMQLLAAAPPSTADVSSANASAITSTPSGATASPAGSLVVSGGTLVDQMNLINSNAGAMIADPVACPVATP